jgi:two-component system chemotaxis response regulator CheY
VKIFIVDDSMAMRMLIKRALRTAGYGDDTIEEAANGADALEAIRESAPDLVLSDWHMPGMSGMDLLQALRQENITVRFGFITTEGTPEMRQRVKDAGADFLIAKPFTSEIMREMIG